MLEQLLLANVENGLNALLQTDTPTLARLSNLSGRVIGFRLAQAPAITLYAIPHAQGITLARSWETPVDCCLVADAATYAALATQADKLSLLHRPGVSLEGNSGILLEFAQIMQDMQLDWEYLLQQWLGPLATSMLAGHLRLRTRWLKQGAESMTQNLRLYLTEETRQLVSRQEFNARFAALDDTKLQLDRLAARIDLLSQRSRTTP